MAYSSGAGGETGARANMVGDLIRVGAEISRDSWSDLVDLGGILIEARFVVTPACDWFCSPDSCDPAWIARRIGPLVIAYRMQR